jgi:hypothetical protein
MEIKYDTEERADAVAIEAHWLAYKASSPRGMGFLHERGGEAREHVVKHLKAGKEMYSDYVFGRMVKLIIWRPDEFTIMVQDEKPTPDYQSWCGTYPTYAELIAAAELSAPTR